MGEFSLGIGAHLLLWVFPLALILLVAVSSICDAGREWDEP